MISILQKHRKIVFLGKLIVSLGLIVYLIRLIDWGRAIQAIDDAPRHLVFIALFLSVTRFSFASWRIQVILADNDVHFSYWQAFSGHLLGMFYGILLPGVVGGDIIRIHRCVTQTRCRVGTASVSVLLERVSGVVALIGFLFLAYLLYPSTVLPMLAFEGTSFVMFVAALGIAALAIFLAGRRRWAKIFLRLDKQKGVWVFIHSAVQTLETLRTSTLGIVLLLSGLFQATDIVIIFLLSRVLELKLSFIVFFAVIPLVYLATLLPISLGGLGIREGTLVFLLAQYGAEASDAAMLSFLVYLSYVLAGITGGIIQLVETIFFNKTSAPPLSDSSGLQQVDQRETTEYNQSNS